MRFIRQNINLDREQSKVARQLAREMGVSFNAYVREALQRHNDGVSMVSVLENSSAHLEVLLDQVREENTTLRRSLQQDHERLREEMKTEQDQAIQRYEDALRHVLTSMSAASTTQRSSPAIRGAGLPVSKPNV